MRKAIYNMTNKMFDLCSKILFKGETNELYCKSEINNKKSVGFSGINVNLKMSAHLEDNN